MSGDHLAAEGGCRTGHYFWCISQGQVCCLKLLGSVYLPQLQSRSPMTPSALDDILGGVEPLTQWGQHGWEGGKGCCSAGRWLCTALLCLRAALALRGEAALVAAVRGSGAAEQPRAHCAAAQPGRIYCSVTAGQVCFVLSTAFLETRSFSPV